MSAAAFFGHRDKDYTQYSGAISKIIEALISDCGIDVFYNGARGNFDSVCAKAVYELKSKYSHVKQLMVLSYHPARDLYVPPWFDETIYLLENDCPPKFAISRTNFEIVKRCDYIISGATLDFGGAWTACEYAKRLNKKIIWIFDSKK